MFLWDRADIFTCSIEVRVLGIYGVVSCAAVQACVHPQHGTTDIEFTRIQNTAHNKPKETSVSHARLSAYRSKLNANAWSE